MLVASEIAEDKVTLSMLAALEPADGRVVVVRPQIDDAVGTIVVRQVLVFGILGEGKVQDLHPRQTDAFAQGAHLVGDHAQVLSNDRQIITERLSKRLEKRIARPGQPASLNRRRFRCRDLPVGLQSAKVVDAQDVHQFEHGLDALYPPAKAIGGDGVPAVKRVSPALPRGAEIVGGDPGNDGELSLVIHVKNSGVGPGVGAVGGNKDRDVANDLDPAFVRIVAQCGPLFEKSELCVLAQVHLIGQLGAPLGQCVGLALDELDLPRVPHGAAVRGLEGHEQSIVVQPVFFFLAETLKRCTLARLRVAIESPHGALQHVHFPVDHRSIVDVVRGQVRRRVQVLCRQVSALHQPLEVNQQRIPGV